MLHAVYDDAPVVCDLPEDYAIQKAHFHWFKGDRQTLRRMEANGYYISITLKMAIFREAYVILELKKKNKTRKFIEEMVNRMEAIGVEPKIKPNAFVASSYANRYTK